jgi:hypothetical protein
MGWIKLPQTLTQSVISRGQRKNEAFSDQPTPGGNPKMTFKIAPHFAPKNLGYPTVKTYSIKLVAHRPNLQRI